MRYLENHPSIGNQNDIFLYNTWIKEEIMKKIRIYFGLNNNENITC